MGGLGPGIGGLEYVVIGIVALVVVGPERLPGMLRALGKMVARARGLANEFRASFEDMARQSELAAATLLEQARAGGELVRLAQHVHRDDFGARVEVQPPRSGRRPW